jgi:hypothetical protein
MKKRIIAAVVALLLSAPAAPAQDQMMKENLLTLAVALVVYDDRCEQLAPKLRADLQRLVRMLDEGDLMEGSLNEQKRVDDVGPARWCAMLRPIVDKYKDGLF